MPYLYIGLYWLYLCTCFLSRLLTKIIVRCIFILFFYLHHNLLYAPPFKSNLFKNMRFNHLYRYTGVIRLRGYLNDLDGKFYWQTLFLCIAGLGLAIAALLYLYREQLTLSKLYTDPSPTSLI